MSESAAIEAVVYRPESGEISRSVTCPPDMLELQAGPGELVLEGAGNDSTHYVVDGALAAYTAEEKSRKSQPPVRRAKWSNQIMDWIDLRTLEQRKEEKWEQLKQARSAALDALLVTPYGVFDSDPESRQNITDSVLLVKTLNELGQPSSIDFTLADNTVRTMTASEMIEVGLLLGAKVQAAHATGRALRLELDAAQTSEEVDSIAWPV